MNSVDIFTLALGLERPWKVSSVEFKDSEREGKRELHIELDFDLGSRFTLSDGSRGTAYDTNRRTWQHLNFFEHRCYLHARVPRILNNEGLPQTVSVPWSREGSGFTLLFEAYSMLFIESEMPVSKASETVGVTAPRIWRVFDYWVSRALKSDSLSNVSKVGVDETSRRKGHNYITLFADLETRRTVFVTEGKDSSVFKAFTSELKTREGDADNIDLISMDMSGAFISGAFENLPKAQIVFDKFHIVQQLNKSLDEIRKKERKGAELLKGHKYTVLSRPKNLRKEKQEILNQLLIRYPRLGEAYTLRELFMDVYTIKDSDTAKSYLAFWCDLAIESQIKELVEFANMIKSRWSGVVRYFEHRVTNGIMEGINSKVQLAKRRARGGRNIRNFINMVYFLTAKLKFDYPQYSL